MKKQFFDILYKYMRDNEDIYCLFVGLGYPRYDEFKQRFGDRAINTEASEQTALDMAVGLAYAGKIPVVYTITPFYWRAAETIRTYISHEDLNVKMIGAGRNDDYSKEDGFSHDATDIHDLFGPLAIFQYEPKGITELGPDLEEILDITKPCFLSLRR